MNSAPHSKGSLLKALQNSEAQYRRLFETAQDGILILDGRTGQITDANPFLIDMLGYTREQLLGKELWEIGFFKDRVLSKEAFEKLHKEGYIRYSCLPLKGKDGRGHEVEYVSNVYQVDHRPVIQCNIREITERQRAARELLESRETLQRVINNIPQHVFWKDRNLNYLGANNVFVRSAGLRAPADIIGKSDRDLSWKESAEAYGAIDREVIETGVPKLNFEETQKRSDGSLLWLRTSKLPMVDDAGKNMGMLGIYEDITQHKEAEDALRKSEANLANAQRIAHLGSWEWHILENKLYWSDEACRIVGLSPKAFGATFEGSLKTVHPADRAAVEKAMQLSLTRKGPYNSDHRVVRPDGSERDVREQGEVICDETGRPIRMVGTTLDITERKQAEAHNREQAALLDNANDAIYVTALDCTILYWNRGAERTYGWTSTEALNHKTTELLAADPVATEALIAVLLKQENWSGERWQMTKDGRKMEMFTRLTLVRNEQGQPRSIFAIDTDITEKKQLETQFLRAQRLESIGALASGIAHDLNNILTPIIIGAPLLREMTRDETSRQLLTTMESSALRGAAIVKQVLTFARGVEGERVPLQPRNLLWEMEKLAAETFPKSIRVEADAAADLWLVLGDATQLHQALLNLCLNARDAMPRGGVLTLQAANIVLSKEEADKMPGAQPGSFACLRVTDTGTGMPPEIEAKIFEPFFTTKGVGKGTGLGLSTALGIVRSHGGFIRVASRVGQGTTFELYLPATKAKQVAVRKDLATPWPHARGEGILLVDDEAAVREVARQALMEFGYQVITAGHGTEALRIFQERRQEIRLVLTDMMMPEMDGPTLIAALRVLDPAVKIVGITGMSDMAGMSALRALALSGILAKPFTIEQLLVVIREALPVAAGHEGSAPAGGGSRPATPG
jgi:PAS domain S-box-containing protein